MTTVALGDVMVARGGSLNPSAFPDEEFELYSIPAHDRGGAEVALGSEIGSSKQIVQPGDVMISRIIPHIRRARVVAPFNGRRQIASSEWIVFRGQSFCADYLRHFLLSDGFHSQFMNTVAGVGGSLVRARPAQVKTIGFPLPPLPEQRRIAAILDHADALRSKRRRILTHLDSVVPAVFSEFASGTDFPQRPLADVAEIWDCPHSTPKWTASGAVCLRTPNLTRGGWNWDDTRYVDETQFEARSKGGGAQPGDIILSREGTVGIAAVVQQGMRVCMGQRLVQVRPDSRLLHPEWALQFLLTALHPDKISKVMVGSTAKHLNVKDLRGLPIPLPPLRDQIVFAERTSAVNATRRDADAARFRDDELFSSLQSRAFRGEL